MRSFLLQPPGKGVEGPCCPGESLQKNVDVVDVYWVLLMQGRDLVVEALVCLGVLC